jgi:hypothetical protein
MEFMVVRVLCLFAWLVTGFAGISVRADLIVAYTFPTTAGLPPAAGYNPTSLQVGVTATAVDRGAGIPLLEISNPTPNYPTQPVLRIDPGAGSTTVNDAVADNRFWTFSVTPGDGPLNLQSLQFDAGRGGSTTARGFALRSSLDGFAANIVAGDVPAQRPSFTPYDIDLTAPVYQNLPVGTPVVFRIYVYSPGGGATLEFDNVRLNGALVPEPGSAGMLGLGLALLFRLRHSLRVNTCISPPPVA